MVLTLSILPSGGQNWYFNYSCGYVYASRRLSYASFDPTPEITLHGNGPSERFFGGYIHNKVISTEIFIS